MAALVYVAHPEARFRCKCDKDPIVPSHQIQIELLDRIWSVVVNGNKSQTSLKGFPVGEWSHQKGKSAKFRPKRLGVKKGK